jgi:hypothetical protein
MTQFVCYVYDIPKNVRPKDYPNPGATLRKFAVHLQQSCWVMPDTMLQRTDDLTADIRSLGGAVHVFRYDEQEHDKIVSAARACLEAEAERIRKYVEASIATTTARLAEAKRMASIAETNSAIRFQQTALYRAMQDLASAEECAVVFDLSGNLGELIQGVRAVITARAAAFALEKSAARSAMQDDDPTTLGFGSPVQNGG